jgi:hypothetical protein
MTMRTFNDAKAMAKVLRQAFTARKVDISHSETLEIVAAQFGLPDWNVLAARINEAEGAPAQGIAIEPAIPIFRIFDVEKAREFYLGFLGFSIDWEHRFGENTPLYCQVSRSGATLHLSEHAGDASPGARAFIPMTGIEAFHAELIGKKYRYMKLGLETVDWGREVTVIDPFSNRLAFCERKEG